MGAGAGNPPGTIAKSRVGFLTLSLFFASPVTPALTYSSYFTASFQFLLLQLTPRFSVLSSSKWPSTSCSPHLPLFLVTSDEVDTCVGAPGLRKQGGIYVY